RGTVNGGPLHQWARARDVVHVVLRVAAKRWREAFDHRSVRGPRFDGASFIELHLDFPRRERRNRNTFTAGDHPYRHAETAVNGERRDGSGDAAKTQYCADDGAGNEQSCGCGNEAVGCLETTP